MAGVNKVILVGRLGKDAEVKTLNSGKPVMNFSVATSETWTDKDGKKQEKTEWHNCVTMNERMTDAISKYLTKGTQVYIEGKLQTRKWEDKNGETRYTTEIMIGPGGTITLLGGGDKPSEPTREPSRSRPTTTTRSKPVEDFDDSIPF